MGFHFVNNLAVARQYADRDGVVVTADITIQNPMIYHDAYDENGLRLDGPGLNRQRVIDNGYDSFMIKERRYMELVIFDLSQIKIVSVTNASEQS